MYKHAIRIGVGLALAGIADAATPTAVTTCDPCSSLNDLRARAQWYSTNYPQSAGSIIFITSLNYPISAFFKVINVCSSGHCYRYVSPVQTSTQADATLDESVYARGMKVLPINAPAPYTETDEWFDLFLQQNLAYTGTKGSAPWGDIPGLPPSSWYQLKDIQTGQLVQAYPGQMITVNYLNGYSEKWQFRGVPSVGCPLNGPCQWQRVPHTLMHGGVLQNPPAPPPPAKPVPNFGSASGALIWPTGNIDMMASPYYCTGSTGITVTAPDGSSIIDTGWFIFPC